MSGEFTEAHINKLTRELDAANAEITRQAKVIDNFQRQVDADLAEIAHWKANHRNMVEKCAFLSQRPDLPVDRIPAYERLAALNAEIAALKENRAPVKESIPTRTGEQGC
jgi:predicted  nucleic acid-binding Zn-ribbon protein